MLLAIAAALIGAALLFLSAPHDGDFWWSDAPRHALNGAFLSDMAAAMPWRDPAGFAVQYYIQYPALTILFYPPLFYVTSAPIFALFGVSHTVVLGIVLTYYVALVAGLYALGRRYLTPGVALATALLAMAAPGIALWGRQPMLEVPTMAFSVWAMLVLRRYVEDDTRTKLWLGLFLLLCAIYTKFNAAFLIPVAGLMLLAADPRGTLMRPRHWLAGAAFVVALAPAVWLTLHFGSANVQSVAAVPDAEVGKWTIGGWTWYARALPELLGWPLLLAALVGLVLVFLPGWDTGGPARRADRVLLLGWIAIGYLFFSCIDLKEPRHATLILPPFLIGAGIALQRVLPNVHLAAIGTAALLAVTAVWTAEYAPVPYYAGYREAALWIGEQAPRGAVVVFSGKRDGSFVFNMRENAAARPDIYTVRADKLLLSIPVRRELGVTERDLSEAEIATMLDRVGASYVVAQLDFWTDLAVMDRFQHVLRSDHFVEVARIPVRSNWPQEDRELAIYRNTHEVAPAGSRLSLDLPMIGRSVQGTIPARQ